MKTNVGSVDRVIRALIGLAGLIGGFYTVSPVNYILWVVGAVMLFTAVTGFCALYRLLGMSTCPARSANK